MSILLNSRNNPVNEWPQYEPGPVARSALGEVILQIDTVLPRDGPSQFLAVVRPL